VIGRAAVSLSFLLAGCPIVDPCTAEETARFELTEAEALAYDVDADGVMSAEECAALCGDQGVAYEMGTDSCARWPRSDPAYPYTWDAGEYVCLGPETGYCK
jgi:hypothetical protein